STLFSFFYLSRDLRDLHSFPTRRSSDLLDLTLTRLAIAKLSQKALRELIGNLHVAHTDGTLSRKLVRAVDLKDYWKRSPEPVEQDRKSTRLNSSHDQISYAVFCLKKKTK